MITIALTVTQEIVVCGKRFRKAGTSEDWACSTVQLALIITTSEVNESCLNLFQGQNCNIFQEALYLKGHSTH